MALATIACVDDAAAQIRLRADGPLARRRLVVIEMSTLPIADKERAREKVEVRGGTCSIVRSAEPPWYEGRRVDVFVSGKASAAKRWPRSSRSLHSARLKWAVRNGTRMKFVANHLVRSTTSRWRNRSLFAARWGLDAQQVWELFAASPIVGNGIFRLRGKFMVDRTYLPATMKVEVWQKDMQVIGDMARAVGAPTPLFSACAPVYNAAMAQGLSQHDTASVAEVLGEMARVPVTQQAQRG